MIDPLLAHLEGKTVEPLPEAVPDETRPTIPQAPTLITLNFFDNKVGKEMWMKACNVVRLQFFTQTERFTPNMHLAAITCFVQLHGPDFFFRYIENYKAENEGARPVPSCAQIDLYQSLVQESVDMGGAVKLGQLYDRDGGTNYHWGSVARLRENQFNELVLDLYLNGERFGLLKLDEPNTDKNEKTANITWRGRYDPHKLWKPKAGRKKAA